MAVKFFLANIVLACMLSSVAGHGYLIDPAARNACYKKFPAKCLTNVNANEQFCGGRQQMINNGGKCGVCGDNYKNKNPPHVTPGKYATGFTTKTYTQGQTITVEVHITANHKGWFEYRIGDIGTPPITQAKLIHLLKAPDGKTRFPLRGSGGSYEQQKLVLPSGLTCEHCVLQWWWKVGNSWGCDNEGCGVGHGDQETFVNCADVKIVPRGGTIPTDPPLPPTQSPVPTDPPMPPTQPPMPPTQPPNPSGCKAIGAWTDNAGMDSWCESNCARGHCPSSMCKCT